MKLDLTQKQDTQYCIPLWLRDEQIKANVQRVAGRVQPTHDRRSEPIAVVGYGPSLTDTWEHVRNFKYVMTCSGAHKFLVDRGVIPTWHVEVDPRAHKVQLIGQPQRETEYLIASTCHPEVLAHLEGFDVKLWHVFDATEDGQQLLPPGEWAITGGCDVGLRALSLAAFLGFRDVHVFGLDGSARDTKHADEHPNTLKKFSECEYEGVVYKTTPGLLSAVQMLWRELDQMPAMSVQFYGEGLIQHMARNYVRKESTVPERLRNVVAVSKQELISAEYADLNKRLHTENLAYGVGGSKHAKVVKELSARLKTTSVLDYGCGKGYLAKELAFPIWEYDPGVAGKEAPPRPADIVVCTDVLEHIEPDKLLYVLDHLRWLTRLVAYFVIHTGPSGKQLADGRNTHLIQEPAEWWQHQLANYFEVGQLYQVGPLVHAVVGVKKSKKKRERPQEEVVHA